MWLLATFIITWALSPGPVAVLTLHESRKHGFWSGIGVVGGATITSGVMVLMALLLHATQFTALLESDNVLMTVIERAGAFGIIAIGLLAAYKSLKSHADDTTEQVVQSNTKLAWIQGMMMMATYIPQALVFYGVIVPNTVVLSEVTSTIILLGTLKVTLIFGWHAMIAFVATRSTNWAMNPRAGKVLQVAMSCLIIGLGFNILI